MSGKGDFQRALEELFNESVRKGYPNRDIKARELHFRGAQEYPKKGNNRIPQCCSVMREAKRGIDRILNKPPKGDGALFEIRYHFPRSK